MPESAGYLITFTVYGERLHGDERGSRERLREKGGGVTELGPDARREAAERGSLTAGVQLTEPLRRAVAAAIEEVCVHRSWRLHATNVRTNHVHAVVSGDDSPEKMMNAFKSWATRALRDRGLVSSGQRVWTRHGSTRYLWSIQDVIDAVQYVVERQGPDLGGVRQTTPDW